MLKKKEKDVPKKKSRKDPESKKTGRKLYDIDPEQVMKLAKIGAKNTEIADFFCCDEGTIRKRFSEKLIQGRAQRKIKLRQLQWQSAESLNVKMLMFLGKNELGQSDKMEAEIKQSTITPDDLTNFIASLSRKENG